MVKTDFILGFGSSILNAFLGTLTLIAIAFGVIVAVALLFVWVRFMLATTRAAQVYVDLNGADAAAARARTTAPTTATKSATGAAAKPAAKPAAKAAPKAAPKASSAKTSAAAKSTPLPKD